MLEYSLKNAASIAVSRMTVPSLERQGPPVLLTISASAGSSNKCSVRSGREFPLQSVRGKFASAPSVMPNEALR
jgi:hypothetical protein